MIHVNGLLGKQGKKVLENNRYALLCAVFLVLFPYTTWASLAIIALVTLKKGWHDGALLLMPVATAFLGVSLVREPTIVAVINTLLTFLPCYIAACVLGWSVSWRAVAGLFFLLAGFTAIVLQMTLPEFIATQYQYLITALEQARPDLLTNVLKDTAQFNPLSIANYFFGFQLISVVVSALLPLVIARNVQSQLYNPGGFRQEMLTLRGNKIGLLLLCVLLIAVNQQQILAMNLLPLLVFYFLLAGLSLCFQMLATKKIRGRFLLLVTPLIVLPFVMLPVYVMIGSLDSLFNLRVYLPSNAGKTT